MSRSWECISNAFEQELGSFHWTTLWCRTTYFALVYNNDLVGAEIRLRKLLLGCEQHCSKFDERYLGVLYKLGRNLYYQKRYTEVEVIGKEGLKWAREVRNPVYETYALEIYAHAQYKLDKMHFAEKNMREAIESFGSPYGRQTPEVVHFMLILEQWLREWKREAEADDLRKEIVELIGPDELSD